MTDSKLPPAARRQGGPRRRLARIALLAPALLLILEVIYLIAANAYLRSGRIEARLDRYQGKFSLRWGSAWTLWPGSIRMTDVTLRGRSQTIDWYTHLDTVAASIRLWPLRDRTVSLRSVSAAGIDYRQRRLAAADASAADLPPLPAMPARPEGPSAPSPAGDAAGAPWTIAADHIDATVAQLWFDQYRLAGTLDVHLSMHMVTRGPMEFTNVRARMDKGDLLAGKEPVLSGLRFDVQTSLGPFTPKGLKAPEVVGLLSGRFLVHAGAGSLAFLNGYLRKAPWLRFNGRAPVEADLRLDHGRLQPGSTLESSLHDVDTDFLDRKLTGRGRLALKVEDGAQGPRSHMEAVLEEFSLAAQGGGKPYAHGRGFKVTASSGALDLSNLFADLDVIADLPEAIIPDLSVYNHYIPPGSGVAIRSGTGTIQYHVEARLEQDVAHGWIKLAADDLVAKFQNYELRGTLKINTPLQDVTAHEGRFDVSGTTLDMESQTFAWTCHIEAPHATLKFTEPLQAHANLKVRMTDTTPLVAIFDAQKDVSRFTEKLLTIQNIEGVATLNVNEHGCELKDVRFTGEDLEALADMTLRDAGKTGILYIKWHIFSVGVAFDKGKRDLDLVRARAWYEKQKAMRQGPRPRG